MALRLSVNLLYKVDLPTLGRPTMATMLLMFMLDSGVKSKESRCFYLICALALNFSILQSVLLILYSVLYYSIVVPKLLQVILFAAPVAYYLNKGLQENFFLKKIFHAAAGISANNF